VGPWGLKLGGTPPLKKGAPKCEKRQKLKGEERRPPAKRKGSPLESVKKRKGVKTPKGAPKKVPQEKGKFKAIGWPQELGKKTLAKTRGSETSSKRVPKESTKRGFPPT